MVVLRSGSLAKWLRVRVRVRVRDRVRARDGARARECFTSFFFFLFSTGLTKYDEHVLCSSLL